MKAKLLGIVLLSFALSACTLVPAEKGLRPRTTEENNVITDSWYPIQSEECQLLVDAFGLVTLAIGNTESQYLLENMDKVKKNLENLSRIVPPKLFELSQSTLEPSIKEYALESIPIFIRLGDLFVDDLEEPTSLFEYLNELSILTGKVPDACKS